MDRGLESHEPSPPKTGETVKSSRPGRVGHLSYGTKSPRKSRSPRSRKEMNRDISCVDDAEIFSRKSELEHMQEIREAAQDPYYI